MWVKVVKNGALWITLGQRLQQRSEWLKPDNNEVIHYLSLFRNMVDEKRGVKSQPNGVRRGLMWN